VSNKVDDGVESGIGRRQSFGAEVYVDVHLIVHRRITAKLQRL